MLSFLKTVQENRIVSKILLPDSKVQLHSFNFAKSRFDIRISITLSLVKVMELDFKLAFRSMTKLIEVGLLNNITLIRGTRSKLPTHSSTRTCLPL